METPQDMNQVNGNRLANHSGKPQRNCGIDLLRVVSMLMICVLHVLQQGGVLSAAPRMGGHYLVGKLLETLVVCGVNCFALISGFVNCTSDVRLRNLFRLWLEVVFYSFGIGLLFWLACPRQVPVRDVVENLFPASMLRYWYFSAYVLLFLSMPMLNAVLSGMPMDKLRNSLFAVFVVVCLFRCVPVLGRMGMEFKDGFSALWLVYLYLVGGFLRKYGLRNLVFPAPGKHPGATRLAEGLIRRIGPRHLDMLGFLSCIGFSWAVSMFAESVGMRLVGRDFRFQALTLYVSPTIFLASLALFHCFSALEPGGAARWVASKLAPMAFAVYLIQTQHEVWRLVFKNAFAWIADFPAVFLPVFTLASAVAIYLACTLVDCLRRALFGLLTIR